jgi:hypothetical protein
MEICWLNLTFQKQMFSFFSLVDFVFAEKGWWSREKRENWQKIKKEEGEKEDVGKLSFKLYI